MRKIPSALLLLAVIPACDGDKSISLSDFPAAAVDAGCSRAARCGLVPDKASCVAASNPDIGQLSADVTAGRVRYDGKAAAACLDALRSLSCNYSDQGGQAELQACREVVSGAVAAGGVCYSGEECISGDCGGELCSGSGCCPGVCSPSASSAGPVPIGSDCSQDIAGCVDGAFCSYSSMPPICQAKAAAGQPCDASSGSEECVAGTYCVASSASTGTCGTPPAEGQTCYPVTSGIACDSSLDFCDEGTLKCIRKIPPGGACPWGVGCVDYAICSSTGMCVAKGRAGDACDETNGPGCLGSLYCYSGTCAFPPATPVCQ